VERILGRSTSTRGAAEGHESPLGAVPVRLSARVVLAARPADPGDVRGHDLPHHGQSTGDQEREHALTRGAGDLLQGDLDVIGESLGVERVLGDDAGTGRRTALKFYGLRDNL